jgi:hypothetical protein
MAGANTSKTADNARALFFNVEPLLFPSRIGHREGGAARTTRSAVSYSVSISETTAFSPTGLIRDAAAEADRCSLAGDHRNPDDYTRL